MNDRELVTTFLLNRDEHAFRALYRSKTPHLYRMARRLTQDESMSDDLVQEMWIVAIRKLGDFQWRSELKTWLIAILLNLYRSKRKADEREVALEAEPHAAERSVETSLIDAQDLERAISALPPGYRQIVILHDIEGYTHQEIAALLDIHEGTSKSQLFHARRTLREYFGERPAKGNHP